MKTVLTVGAVVGMALALGACKHDLSAKEQDTARYGAMQFSNSVHGRFISCSSTDIGGKGLVPCTVQIPGGVSHNGRALEITEIACSYKGNAGNSGCTIKR